MCIRCLKKWCRRNCNAKGVKNFLRPNRVNLSLFVAIIAVHIALSLCLIIGGFSYRVFTSILYSLFNFPVFVTSLSLSGYSIYTLSAVSMILPLIIHIIYWYIMACFIRVPIAIKKDMELRYRYAFYILAAFFIFAVLTALWFSLTIGSVYVL